MYNQDIIYNQHSLGAFLGIRPCNNHNGLSRGQRRKQRKGVKDRMEEIVFTSETCSSTSLRRWRILDMNWIAEWQEGEEAGGSALSGSGFVSACV